MKDFNSKELSQQLREFCQEDKGNRAVFAIIAEKGGHTGVLHGGHEAITAALAISMICEPELVGIIKTAVRVYEKNAGKCACAPSPIEN